MNPLPIRRRTRDEERTADFTRHQDAARAKVLEHAEKALHAAEDVGGWLGAWQPAQPGTLEHIRMGIDSLRAVIRDVTPPAPIPTIVGVTDAAPAPEVETPVTADPVGVVEDIVADLLDVPRKPTVIKIDSSDMPGPDNDWRAKVGDTDDTGELG